MKANEVMARDVLTATPETTISVAIGLMLQKRVSGLPVVNANGALVGILTEGDLLRRAETGTGTKHRSMFMEFLVGPGKEAQEYVRSHSRRVGDLMTPEVVFVAPDADLDSVVSLMERHHVRRVPVVEAKRLVGIISRADLLRALGRKLSALAPCSTDDVSIEHALREELAATKWVVGANIDIKVRDGVVQLDGFIYDERLRQALNVAAQNVAGSKGVIDKMVWIDTTTAMTASA